MTEELFVEWKSESSIDVEAVEHSHAQHTTNKVEVWQMLLEIGKYGREEGENWLILDEIKYYNYCSLIMQLLLSKLTGLTAESGLICSV